MLLRRVILPLLLVAIAPLEAQRRRGYSEPIPSWGVDVATRYSVLADDDATFAALRVGRQIDSSLNLGFGGSLMMTESVETRTSGGFERFTSLLATGPSIELRDSLRGPVRVLLSVSLVGGLLGYEQQRDGFRSDGTTVVVGIDPGLGIQVRATRRLQASATVGALSIWRLDGGRTIHSGPVASMAIRVLF